ncbi:MAG: uroporphyrinogen-III synthase [Elusimicrobia bacterium]|nr:uroporphyrinogen-III synthase [Elusimicrobiota bacterium]
MRPSTSKPLACQTVLLLRDKLGPEKNRLKKLGACVVHAPLLIKKDNGAAGSHHPAAGGRPGFDWVIFTSATGVVAALRRLNLSPVVRSARLACVGPATAAATRRMFGFKPAFLPSAYTTQCLAQELPVKKNQRVLLIRSENADHSMDRLLQRRGARVVRLSPYRLEYRPFAPGILTLLRSGKLDYVLFGSRSQAQAFRKGLSSNWRPVRRRLLKEEMTALAIGPETARALSGLGIPYQQAQTHTFDGLIDLMIELCAKKNSNNV